MDDSEDGSRMVGTCGEARARSTWNNGLRRRSVYREGTRYAVLAAQLGIVLGGGARRRRSGLRRGRTFDRRSDQYLPGPVAGRRGDLLQRRGDQPLVRPRTTV